MLFFYIFLSLCFAWVPISEEIAHNCTNAKPTIDQLQTFNISETSLLQRYYSNVQNPFISRSIFSKIKLIIIIQHGGLRNVEDYYCYGMDAIGLQSTFTADEVLLITPWFDYVSDDPAPKINEVYWNGTKMEGWWPAGGYTVSMLDSISQKNMSFSSYEIYDDMIKKLMNNTKFPNLEKRWVVGHSAGGQTLQRYSLYSKLAQIAQWEFIIMNPSSYNYKTNERWNYTCNVTAETCGPYKKIRINENEDQQTPYIGGLCTDLTTTKGHYNAWHYGNQYDTIPYLVAHDFEHYWNRYKSLSVYFIHGSEDNCNTEFPWMTGKCNQHSLDTSCAALWQGPWRLARYENYKKYLTQLYGHEVHTWGLVDGMYHEGGFMITSSEVREIVFYKSSQQYGNSSASDCTHNCKKHHQFTIAHYVIFGIFLLICFTCPIYSYYKCFNSHLFYTFEDNRASRVREASMRWTRLVDDDQVGIQPEEDTKFTRLVDDDFHEEMSMDGGL